MEKKEREREKAPVQIRTPEINVEMEGNLGFCHAWRELTGACSWHPHRSPLEYAVPSCSTCVSLSLRGVSSRLHTLGSRLFLHSAAPRLLMGEFHPHTFMEVHSCHCNPVTNSGDRQGRAGDVIFFTCLIARPSLSLSCHLPGVG